MKIKFSGEVAIVIMTVDELGITRYTLSAGVEKLERDASFITSFDRQEGQSATKTAQKAKKS